MLIHLSDKTVRLYFEHTLVPRLDKYRCRGIHAVVLADMENELQGYEHLQLRSKRRSFLERRLRAPQTTARLEYIAETAPDGKRTWRELTHATVRKFVGDRSQAKHEAALHAFHAMMKTAPLSDTDKATLAQAYIDNRHRKPSVRELKRELTRLVSENKALTDENKIMVDRLSLVGTKIDALLLKYE
jgi:type II secretory pathway component HofQ